PDGAFVYFARTEAGFGTLYRVPTLGGTPVKIAARVDSQVSFSPDGTKMAFARSTPAEGEIALMIADVDGTGERKLLARTGHQYLVGNSIAWSPDGKFLALAIGDDTFEHQRIMATADLSTGEVTEFGKQRFDLLSFAVWTADQSELLVLASQNGQNSLRQVWTIKYPSGEASQLTHDLLDYHYLSITSDSKNLVAVQRQSFGSIWYSSAGDISKVAQVSRAKTEGTWGMTMTPDGRIVYVSNSSGATEIWIMNGDGSGAKQLTSDGISKYTPTVTGDGRYIVFVSEKGGRRLWRMDLDGGQQTQITNGPDDGNPRATPDGNWVVYDSFRSGKQVLWRVSVNGGEPIQITDFPALESDVSPDGKFVACFTTELNPDKKWEIVIVPFEGGSVVNKLPVPQTVSVDSSPYWTSDGKGITYVDARDDVGNVWVQPIDGGPAKQLTNYKQGYLFRREWSRHGKGVAIVLGSETSDAVMFTNFR
ncbi:MAG TPA: hypothetical protein VJV05_14060, partial [Pyrinomonadaceae bacterium]|nr:hypothetical protein [Pyrinomonadaceae bacterium]